MFRRIAVATVACLVSTNVCSASSLITAPPVPQPRNPGDLVGLMLQNAGADRIHGKLISFGQIFRNGQLAKDSDIAAHIGKSTEPAQADVKSTYPDGSVRFAVLTMAAPPLTAGQMVPVMLVASASPPVGSIDFERSLAAHNITITLNLSAVGDPASTGQTAQTVTLNAATLLANAMMNHTASPWLSGPLAEETRITHQVAGSLRVVLDIRAYASGAISADIQFNNDIAMQTQGGMARYGVTITQSGRTVFTMPQIVQYQYQDWHTIIRSDGRSPINVVHDVAAMENAGAIPSYELKYGVAPQVLVAEARQIHTPGWDAPLSDAGLAAYEPMTGGRPEIGPTTDANAIWLITQSPTAAVYALSQADTAGALPWHMFNWQTGNFLTTQDIPNIWTDGRGGPHSYTVGLTQQVNSANGWHPDTAHEPDLAYIPFLMTGRRYYLDQINAMATWNETSFWPAKVARNEGQGIIVGGGAQVRGSAWVLRSVNEAAYINPDDSVMKAYFTKMVANNMSYLVNMIPAWITSEGEPYGYLPGVYRGGADMAPWQQDFFITTIGLMAQQGNQMAVQVMNWANNFMSGRFLSARKGFNPHDGITYNMGVYDPKLKTTVRTWSELEDLTEAHGQENGNGWLHSRGYYAQTAAAALASEINVTHSESSWRAYEWLQQSGAPDFDLDAYAMQPQYWIVPLAKKPSNWASIDTQ
jgi:hypothetical protein